MYFRWNLISKDPDDNKFADCAVASGAKYLVSNVKDFRILSTIRFPPIKVINADKFLEELDLLLKS
ncbi:putative toxin-antitoxin system toxin component, PIN family [Membranihabitans marinus]|uniref:PIN domain-containing protein n=1 Tax=Membranihabitans marinus TaxID=1227546 RepID=UPI0039656270